MTSEERRQRSARMWKIIVAALSGATLATIVVASCLDRDEDAKLDEPGITQVTSTEMPAGGAASASATDTSSGISGDHGAAGVPADLPRNAADTPVEPSSTDSSTGAAVSRAPILVERVENMSINVTSTSTQPAPGDASNVAGAGTQPVAGHASHQDNDPNALVERGLSNSASGVPTANTDDAGAPPPVFWNPPGPAILQGVPNAGAPTTPAPMPAAPTATTSPVQGGAPVRGGAPISGGAPPSAPSPTTPMVQPIR